MQLPDFSMADLVDVGAHFGHKAHRWNPKMRSYIFDTRQGLHILDMTQTVPRLYEAMAEIKDIVARHGRVLFVGTKRQANRPIADAAVRCSQYYVNYRWLGGMLTNWKTVANSIKRLESLERELEQENLGITKKEILNKQREYDKLQRTLGGVRHMGGMPDILFVVDTNREAIAVKEATRLGIPVAAIIDSDSDPEGITYPIPGNDDSASAVQFFCDMVARAAIQGLEISVDNMPREKEGSPEEKAAVWRLESDGSTKDVARAATEAEGEKE